MLLCVASPNGDCPSLSVIVSSEPAAVLLLYACLFFICLPQQKKRKYIYVYMKECIEKRN